MARRARQTEPMAGCDGRRRCAQYLCVRPKAVVRGVKTGRYYPAGRRECLLLQTRLLFAFQLGLQLCLGLQPVLPVRAGLAASLYPDLVCPPGNLIVGDHRGLRGRGCLSAGGACCHGRSATHPGGIAVRRTGISCGLCLTHRWPPTATNKCLYVPMASCSRRHVPRFAIESQEDHACPCKCTAQPGHSFDACRSAVTPRHV
jgi:hypothetical protein